MKYVSFIALVFLIHPVSSGCQNNKSSKLKDTIKTVNGDVLLGNSTKKVYNKKTIIYKSYTEENKDKILNTKGWLDSTKPILIKFGSNTGEVDISDLQAGGIFDIAHYLNLGRHGFISLKMRYDSGRLYLYSDILGYDGKFLAKIRDNKLFVVEGKTFEPYYTNTIFEVVESDYSVPVLQILLEKNNTITINGVFCSDYGCTILYPGNFLLTGYNRHSIKEFTQTQKDSIQEDLFQRARKVLFSYYQ
jgi:hypothetical protein